MGIYFIAAGNSSKNRDKSLDKNFSLDELRKYIPEDIQRKLEKEFPTGRGIYLWGANERNTTDLKCVRTGEFVVDVKNKNVQQVFTFCFYYLTRDTRLQEYVGWDSEKPLKDKRPYDYVYFLRDPQRTTRGDKKYFQAAFNQTANQNWLVGQRYFDKSEVDTAIQKMACLNVYDFLGIDS